MLYEVITELLDVEGDRPVDGAGLPTHVQLPGVAARLASTAGVLLAAEGATDLLVHWPGKLAAHGRTYLDLMRRFLQIILPLLVLVLSGLLASWIIRNQPEPEQESYNFV